MGRPATQHTTIWRNANELPQPCFFCGEPVTDDCVVHHVDHDRTNNALDNLMPSHRACHTQHHTTEAWKRGRRQSLPRGRAPGFTHSVETRERQRESNVGKKHVWSDDGRRRYAVSQSEKRLCDCGCGRELNSRWITRHMRAK